MAGNGASSRGKRLGAGARAGSRSQRCRSGAAAGARKLLLAWRSGGGGRRGPADGDERTLRG